MNIGPINLNEVPVMSYKAVVKRRNKMAFRRFVRKHK